MSSVNKFHVEYAFNKWLLLLMLLLFAIPWPVIPLKAGLYPQNLGYNRCLMVWRIAIWTHIFLNVLKNIFPLLNNYFTFMFSLESVLHSEQQERAYSNGKPSYLSQRFPNAQKTTPNFEGTWLILPLSFLQNVLCLHLLWCVWYCPESEHVSLRSYVFPPLPILLIFDERCWIIVKRVTQEGVETSNPALGFWNKNCLRPFKGNSDSHRVLTKGFHSVAHWDLQKGVKYASPILIPGHLKPIWKITFVNL